MRMMNVGCGFLLMGVLLCGCQHPSEQDAQIERLVATIDDNPDLLHSQDTPSAAKLIAIGRPAIPKMLDLMSSPREDTRFRAEIVVFYIMVKEYGLEPGRGGPWREDAFNAFWKSMGPLDSEDPAPKREHAVELWRQWLKKNP